MTASVFKSPMLVENVRLKYTDGEQQSHRSLVANPTRGRQKIEEEEKRIGR